MVLDNGFEIRRVIEQVVTDTATDKCLLDTLHRANLLIKSQQWAVVVVQIRANLRMEARGTMALTARIAILTTHTVHIGRRSSHVREIASEVGHLGHLLHLGEDRALATRVDKLTLMRRDSTKSATAKATAMDIYRVLDHLPRGNVALAVVAGVRSSLVGKIERVVQLLGRKRRIWRSDNDILLAHLLNERGRGLHSVAQRLLLNEVTRKGLFIAAALLV